MKADLIDFLCDPIDQSELVLQNEVLNSDGSIESGVLVSESGRRYPIMSGVPRFVSDNSIKDSVDSFGQEWNYFNYDYFKINWLQHVVLNTFGTTDVFKDKIIVDCGAGSGMQSKLGAKRVIALELSQSVDGVMKTNLAQALHFVYQNNNHGPAIKFIAD